MSPRRAGPWDRDRIVAAMQEFAAATGRPPTPGDWHHQTASNPGFSTVYRVMKSWPEALAAAGFETTASGRQWEVEQIIRAIRDHHERTGVAPSSWAWRSAGADHPSFMTVLARFGTWEAALRAAGVVSKARTDPRASVLAALRQYRERHGELPWLGEWQAAHLAGDLPSVAAIRAAFGSVEGAAAAVEAGYGSFEWRRDRTLRLLRSAAEESGRIHRRGWSRRGPGYPSVAEVARLFGSWDLALRAAGVSRGRSVRWTRAAIAAALNQHLKRYGDYPRASDWLAAPLEGERPSSYTVLRRFGTWERALQAAAADPNPGPGSEGTQPPR